MIGLPGHAGTLPIACSELMMTKLKITSLNSSHDLGRLEYAEHVRIDGRLRLYTGTVGGKFSFTEFANKILRENAAGAVPRAEEKNFQRWGCHGELRLSRLALQTDIAKASL
jgi:hypothetical protein